MCQTECFRFSGRVPPTYEHSYVDDCLRWLIEMPPNYGSSYRSSLSKEVFSSVNGAHVLPDDLEGSLTEMLTPILWVLRGMQPLIIFGSLLLLTTSRPFTSLACSPPQLKSSFNTVGSKILAGMTLFHMPGTTGDINFICLQRS